MSEQLAEKVTPVEVYGPISPELRALLEDVVNEGEAREEFSELEQGVLNLPAERREVYARLRLYFNLTPREPESFE